MRGKITVYPLNSPEEILASIICFPKYYIIALVPFIIIGDLIFLIIITWAPTFNYNSCGGILGNSNLFKNSLGKFVTLSSPT